MIKGQPYDSWVVVCDKDIDKYTFTLGQHVINRDPSKDTLHSICHNLLAAVPYLGDKVIVIEDDELYHPKEYVALMSEALDDAELVGMSPSFYYNTKFREYRVYHKDKPPQCPLAVSAFRSSVIPYLVQACNLGDPFVDSWLWRYAPVSKKIIANKFRVISLKDGTNIGMGGLKGGVPDPKGKILQVWLDKFNQPSIGSSNPQ